MSERNLIKKDLLEQLHKRGATQSYYNSLVDDYLSFYDVKNNLIEDIEERGVAIPWNNGGGQCGVKKNDSVAELTKINAQMLKILSELGLRGADIKVEDEYEEL